MLGVFSAGVASSSAVSVQGYSNLASTVDMSIGSHDKSANVKSKFSDESAVAADENNIDAETTTDEEVQTISSEDKTDLPENLDKENKENTDYMFVSDKTKKIKLAKGIAVAGAGVSTIGIGFFGISKLVKSSGNEKKDEPSPEINPGSDNTKEEEKDPAEKFKEEEEGGFEE